MIHPTLAGRRAAFAIGHAHRALESRRCVAAFVALHFELEQLERDRQRLLLPTVSDLNRCRLNRHRNLPTGGNPLLDVLAVLPHANAHTFRRVLVRRGVRERMKVHPLLRVRHCLIDDELPVRPTSR